MKLKTTVFAILWATLLISSCIDADQRQGMSLTEADKRFFVKLSDAVKSDNRDWVANHISFPLMVTIDQKRTTVKDRKDFLSQYESILTSKVKIALASQDAEKLFKNWRGLMVGNGEIWFTAIQLDPNNSQKLDYYITGINN